MLKSQKNESQKVKNDEKPLLLYRGMNVKIFKPEMRKQNEQESEWVRMRATERVHVCLCSKEQK